MNWPLLLPLVITAIITILGWFAAHRLTSDRDRANKHRDIRLQYLIEAYRRLENAAGRHLPSEPDYSQQLESAIADIQLFGNTSQVEKLQKIFEEQQSTGDASLNELINDLRNELRKELNLPQISGNVQWVRIEQSTSKQALDSKLDARSIVASDQGHKVSYEQKTTQHRISRLRLYGAHALQRVPASRTFF